MNTDQPAWEPRPDGSRTRITNGIRITVSAPRARTQIDHLVTWQEDGGSVRILGLDAGCRPVYTTTFDRS
jgi:hypothetical protein